MVNEQLKGSLLLRRGDVLFWDGKQWETKEADVLIDGDRIAYIGNTASAHIDADQVLDCQGMVIFPGLHNCHSHLLELWQRSVRERLPLEPWAPFKAALDIAVDLQPQEIEAIVRLACLELLRNGVTAVVDHMFQRPKFSADSLEAALTALSSSGIRGWLAPGMVDVSVAEMHGLKPEQIPVEHRVQLTKRPPLPASEQLALTEHAIAKVREMNNPRLGVIVGPGAPTFCSRELFEQSVDLAFTHDLLLHTHLLETRGQRLVSSDRFGAETIDYLEDIGALGPRLLAAHVIWVDQDDIRRLAGAGVSVVHNPCSNLRAGSGLCPLLELRDAGINLAFGTDGGDSSDSYSVIDQARVAALVHRMSDPRPDRWITGEDAFTMATIGGGAILNDGESGNIEVGKLADLVVMERDYRFLPPGNLARQLVHVGGGNVRHVIVGGQIAIRDGHSVLVDEQADVEVLYGVIRRGMDAYDMTVAEGERVYPFLRGVYDKAIDRIGSFKPGEATQPKNF